MIFDIESSNKFLNEIIVKIEEKVDNIQENNKIIEVFDNNFYGFLIFDKK